MQKKCTFCLLSLFFIISLSFPIFNFDFSVSSKGFTDRVITDTDSVFNTQFGTPINALDKDIPENNFKSLISNFFIENKGQFGDEFEFYTKYSDVYVGFSSSQITFFVEEKEINLNFIGANEILPKGSQSLNSVSNYYIGDQFYSQIHHYNRVIYENLYDGISLVYRFTELGLKYDFVVEPFADINQITIEYSGLDDLLLTSTKLELVIGNSRIVDDNLVAWYELTRNPIPINFNRVKSTSNKNLVNFSLKGFYDNSQRIIIDPLICTYSTFIGGDNLEYPYRGADISEQDLIVDDNDYIYYAGRTSSTNFPTLNAYQSVFKGEYDAILLKMAPDGQSLIFATLLGGLSHDWANGVDVDASGNIALVGTTQSNNFPILNAFQDVFAGGSADEPTDAFLAKFNSTGSLLFSTFFGGSGSDWGCAVQFDASGNIVYSGGSSSDDFYTKNAYQTVQNGPSDITLTKFAANGQSIIFSTFYGGDGSEGGRDLVVDSNGNLIVTGFTSGTSFPTHNAYQTTVTGFFASFIVKFSPTGSLKFATTIDGSGYDISHSVTVDSSDNIYITGASVSPDYPIENATQTSLSGNSDVVITKLSPNGQTLLFSTFFGGQNGDEAHGINIDNDGNMVVVGITSSTDFPIKHAYQNTFSGNYDVCVILIASNGTLLSSSFLGGSNQDQATGIAIDSENTFVIGGWTLSSNFPNINAFQSSLKGTNDIFITKLYFDPTAVVTSTTALGNEISFIFPTIFLILSLLGGNLILRKKK